MLNPNDIPDELRNQLLAEPSGKIAAVLDTDTYNEIDDQFALVYGVLAPSVALEAVYAAPFHNSRSEGPGDGMAKSYEEILRVLDRLDVDPEGYVYKGSEQFLADPDRPVESPAARDLVARAMACEEQPLYVATVGAPTNVSSAILMEPRVRERIVVVWLGGHAHTWPDTKEFNCKQDPHASRVLLDSGVALVQIPCAGCCDRLLTTKAEMAVNVAGRGEIGDYLMEIYSDFVADRPAQSKVLWDVSAIAWLINPSWIRTSLVPSPILTDEITWAFDDSRHRIRVAQWLNRDGIYRDFFRLLP